MTKMVCFHFGQNLTSTDNEYARLVYVVARFLLIYLIYISAQVQNRLRLKPDFKTARIREFNITK